MAVLFLPHAYTFYFFFCYLIMLTRSSSSALDGSNNGGHPCLETDFEMFLAFYP